jgi:hypothetical protein
MFSRLLVEQEVRCLCATDALPPELWFSPPHATRTGFVTYELVLHELSHHPWAVVLGRMLPLTPAFLLT